MLPEHKSEENPNYGKHEHFKFQPNKDIVSVYRNVISNSFFTLRYNKLSRGCSPESMMSYFDSQCRLILYQSSSTWLEISRRKLVSKFSSFRRQCLLMGLLRRSTTVRQSLLMASSVSISEKWAWIEMLCECGSCNSTFLCTTHPKSHCAGRPESTAWAAWRQLEVERWMNCERCSGCLTHSDWWIRLAASTVDCVRGWDLQTNKVRYNMYIG